jgi:tetratricopeptide (TPR) repeat protein
MTDLITEWTARFKRRRQAWQQDRRGRRLYAEGKFAEAADAYQAALSVAGDRPLTLINYGLALYKDNRKQEARASWERALEMTSGVNSYITEQVIILLRQFG